MNRYYCPLCDEIVADDPCPDCGTDTDRIEPRPLTRNEQLEALADAGIDTWEDYRCEK